MGYFNKILLSFGAVGAAISSFILGAKVNPAAIPIQDPIAIPVPAPKISPFDDNFQYAVEKIIRHEGGLSNHKDDKGSWTKYGISLRYLQNENFDLNGDGIISKEDVIHLTRTEADKIYYKEWYLKHKYNLIKDKIVMTDIMDFSINTGASQCHKTLKRAINRIVINQVPVDSVLDDGTIALINSLNQVEFHKALNQEQEKFYRLLVKNNPALSVFINGWLRRSQD